jgi:hypothetical protein
MRRGFEKGKYSLGITIKMFGNEEVQGTVSESHVSQY